MSDKEIWLLLFHALLNQNRQLEAIATEADEALEIYKRRWVESANE